MDPRDEGIVLEVQVEELEARIAPGETVSPLLRPIIEGDLPRIAPQVAGKHN